MRSIHRQFHLHSGCQWRRPRLLHPDLLGHGHPLLFDLGVSVLLAVPLVRVHSQHVDRLAGLLLLFPLIDLEHPRPVEEIDKEEEDDHGEEDADEHAHHDVGRVVLVVGDAREADVEGEGEHAELHEGAEDLEAAEDDDMKHHWDYIYEPDAKELLDVLLVRFIESQVYQGVVENLACEMAARMIAMKSATDNAGELIDELELIYNKARQAAITQELSEIVAGAAAV